MKAAKTIPTILGVLILVSGLALGVFLVQQQQMFRLGASPEKAPRDVRITNITNSSFTVSWITDKNLAGYVEWGEQTDLGEVAWQENEGSTRIHYVRIVGLSPGKKYYFEINSGGEIFRNDGSVWEVITLATAPTTTNIISGKVLDANNLPASDVLLYAKIADKYFSSLTTRSGEFVISVTSDYEKDQLVEIFVQGGSLGVASVKAYLGNSNPLPDITFGYAYDFTAEESGQDTESKIPTSDIKLPEDEEKSSRFEKLNVDLESENVEVTLDNLEEGEEILEDKPEFFGTGPAGSNITIVVESDPLTDEIIVDQFGQWSWTPPEGLAAGEHTITISWRDALGILHSLTRSFEVLAAGDESASTPSPTATPLPTVTPLPTALPDDVPVSGVGFVTLIFAAIGFLLLVIGILISREDKLILD